MSMQQVTIIVYGQVQGVGYRYNAHLEAVKLGLVGYVRNCSNGTVKIVAEGDPIPLEKLVRWAQQGPPAAKVAHVDVTYEPVLGQETFAAFSIDR